MHKTFKIGLLLLAIALTQGLWAQSYSVKEDYQTKFYNLTTKDGLSHPKVLDIYQDRYGFMWFATADGLNRYDGYEFIVYKNVAGDSASISGNLVTCITEDPYGDLWVGTHYGLNKYDRKNNTFVHYMKKPEGLSDNYVRAFHCSKEGILWIETADGVLNKFDIQKQTFTAYPHKVGAQFYYPNHAVYEDKEGYIWIGARSIYPHKFDPKTGTFERFPNSPDSPKNENDVACFFEDSQDQFWVSALDGAFTFDKKDQFVEFLNTSTYSIIEDKLGQLWFGTGYGLNVYNKQRKEMTHFDADENNPYALIGSQINKLYQDRSGIIWIATNDGISKYAPQRDKFLHYYHVAGNEKTLSSNQVTAVVEDLDGLLWIGTKNAGLNSFDRTTGTFKSYKHKPKDPKSISSNRISNLYVDQQGTLWIGLWAGVGFNKYDKATDSFTKYVYNPSTTWFDWYNDFLEDSQGDFWVGLWGNHGLYPFDRDKGQFPYQSFLPTVVPQNTPINDLVIFGDSILWIANKRRTISKLNLKKSGQFNYYVPSKGDQEHDYQEKLKQEQHGLKYSSLKDFNIVHQVVADQNQDLWVATDQGLYQYLIAEDDFRLIEATAAKSISVLHASQEPHVLYLVSGKELFQLNTKTEALQAIKIQQKENITTLYEGAEGYLWVGTTKGLLRFNSKTKTSKNFHPDTEVTIYDMVPVDSAQVYICSSEGLFMLDLTEEAILQDAFKNNKNIYTAFKDDKNTLWFATDHGLCMLSKEEGEIVLKEVPLKPAYPIDLEGLKILSIDAVSGTELLYLATNKGLFSYHTQNQSLYYIRPHEYRFQMKPVHLVTDLLEDREGAIWLGTTNTGLGRYHSESHKLEQFFHYPYDSTSYRGEGANCIFEDSKGRLWIAGDGLNQFDRATSSFTHIGIEDGLPSSNIMGILEDHQGNLWLSTDKGLIRFNPENQSIETWNESDGLQDNAFSKAHTKLRSGEIVVGGKNGFNIFHPDSLFENNYKPDIVLTKIKVFDEERYRDVSQIKALSLAYDENTLTFEFAALDYTNPEQNQYKYILEGYDRDWVICASDERRVKYTNIPHGTYTFKVLGTNNDGHWSEAGVFLELNIKPPFWKTLWFYGIELILVLLAFYFVIRYRENKIRAKQKTIELEQRLLRSQMNPHFIFNSLNAIQSYIFKKKPLEAGAYLSDFSDLVRSILENSRNEYVLLEKEIKTLEYYLELQQLRFDNKFSYTLEVDSGIDAETMMIPPMLAQPFIENSIEHGFKDMEKEGRITIKFSKEEEHLLFVTEDNGMGIDVSMQKKNGRKEVGNKNKHKSLASIITKERIENINRTANQKITLKIEDLKSLDEKQSGTRVSFKLPIKFIDE